ncbi:hypothetical protein Tdes44962_MAKER07229 [Teratosphaeria destructans]|uniref:Uncharacterized protein n=1 Tax=Teratosphaeria destructans TaxID=418781 RepID=A0A9W7W6H2_9PEZI|nr:hypothetical protein Tdes44962_MAKER07229 [Teratosphaeria destructans]
MIFDIAFSHARPLSLSRTYFFEAPVLRAAHHDSYSLGIGSSLALVEQVALKRIRVAEIVVLEGLAPNLSAMSARRGEAHGVP